MELLVVIKNYWRSIFLKKKSIDNMHQVIGSYSRLYDDASL